MQMEKIEFDIFDFPVAKYRDKRVEVIAERKENPRKISPLSYLAALLYTAMRYLCHTAVRRRKRKYSRVQSKFSPRRKAKRLLKC